MLRLELNFFEREFVNVTDQLIVSVKTTPKPLPNSKHFSLQ